MSRLPFTVTGQSLTFFVKGRPHSLTRDHQNYDQVRTLLTTPGADHDVDLLVDLVDTRRALQRASFGRIQFDGNEIIWQGRPLHNIWVERILEFRERNEDHGPLFNALDKLVHNPTPAAIERLPIFLDRVALPFMPDGRFLAFKGVQADYCSAHASPDGTRFTHQVGDKPRMPREQVDPNPNNTCSTGLHVGAPGYVRGHYSGGDYALVLVAVDPVDVVSVPTDYNGEKMRVCGYEVIEHLDQDYSDELFGRLRDTYITPKSEPETDETDEEDAEPYDTIKVGDVIEWSEGVSLVIDLDDGPHVRNLYGEREHVREDEFHAIVEPGDVTAAMVTTEGCLVRIQGDPMLRDGDYSVVVDNDMGLSQVDGDEQAFSVAPVGRDEPVVPVLNGSIQVVSFKGEHLWPRPVEAAIAAAVEAADQPVPAPRAEIGDLVEIDGSGFPPAGVYPVIELLPAGYVLKTEYDGYVSITLDRVANISRRPWMRAEIGGTVTLSHSSVSGVGAGTYEVGDLRLDAVSPQVEVRGHSFGSCWVFATRVTAVTPKPKA